PPPPLPQATGQPGIEPTPPGAELTKLPTLPAKEATATATPTTPVKKEEATPTSALPPKVAPTEPPKPNPTPAPTKLPVPPAPVVGSTDPTINTGNDGDPSKQIIQPLPGQGS